MAKLGLRATSAGGEPTTTTTDINTNGYNNNGIQQQRLNPQQSRRQNNGATNSNRDITHNSDNKSHAHQQKSKQKSSLQRDKFCDSDFDKLVIDTSQKISREKSYNLLSELDDCCEDLTSCKVQQNTAPASVDIENCDQTTRVVQQALSGEDNNKQQIASSPSNSATSDSTSGTSNDSINNTEHTQEGAANGTELHRQYSARTGTKKVSTCSLSSPAAPINIHNVTASNQPKRPMNAFMVWGQAVRRELHHRFSNVQNALLSKALGRVWRSLDAVDKEPYIRKANVIKAAHKRDYPNYRYQPRRIQERHQTHRAEYEQVQEAKAVEQPVSKGQVIQQQQVLQLACNNNEQVVNQDFSDNNNQTRAASQIVHEQKFPDLFASAASQIDTSSCAGSEPLLKETTSVCGFAAHVGSPAAPARQLSKIKPQIHKHDCLQPLGELESRSPETTAAEISGRSKHLVHQQHIIDRQQQLMPDVYQNSNGRVYFSRQPHLQEAPDCYSATDNVDQYETNSNYAYLVGTQYHNSNEHHHQHQQHQQQQHHHHHHHHNHHHQQQELLIDNHNGKQQALSHQVSHNMPYHMELNFTTTAPDGSTPQHQLQHQPLSEHLYSCAQHTQHPMTIDGSYEHQFVFAASSLSTASSLPTSTALGAGHNSLVMSRGCELNNQVNGSCIMHNHQHQNCT